MNTPASGLRLRRLGFFGPQKPAASVTFGSGLNVLYGASDTGKSFVVEAIDFMMGGKPPLREIPERVGYDRVLLGVETLDGEAFTIVRSVDGGSFLLYEGLHEEPPGQDVQAKVLAEQHSEKNDTNLSTFLLGHCGLAGKRVRKNARGETNSLSFRNIARLMIVTETEITQQRSPLSDGNVVADTSNLSTFKLLLTGVDDSALVTGAQREPEELSREAQLQLLDQLLGDYRDRLKELTKSPNELQEQLQKIESSLRQHADQLSATEATFQQTAGRRRELRKKLEESRDRRNEVGALLERFSLLDRHYVSDIERLRAIEEGGTLFGVLGSASCPLCGAEPSHHRANSECDGNIDAVVEAARMEIAKIELLRTELAVTISELHREGTSFDRRMPTVVQELEEISGQVDRLIAPKLAKLRSSYSEFADKRSEVREALALLATVQDMERRLADLGKGQNDRTQTVVAQGDIPASVAESFAQSVEAILNAWHFPEAGRVFFDAKTRDLVIAGKQRVARGKGLRAITHAAFTLGLLDYCRTNVKPHPGFVILDSPLLAYREPDGTDDDLTGTDLKEQFYGYLQSLADDRQVIVVENTDPPPAIKSLEQVKMFSKNPHSGRYGLFPFIAGTTA
jgi:prefoldin subunit 5